MNTPRVAMQETKKAFRKLAKTGDIQAASQSLCTLKGVGPGMASGEPTWPQNLIRVGARSLTTLTKLCPLLTTYLIRWHFWTNFFTVIREELHSFDITSTAYLPTSSCQRSLWMPPRAHQNQTVPSKTKSYQKYFFCDALYRYIPPIIQSVTYQGKGVSAKYL